jgi:hypothetical protein
MIFSKFSYDDVITKVAEENMMTTSDRKKNQYIHTGQ